SALDQLTLADLIASGAYDRHVRKARLAYRHRRDKLIASLERHAPQARVTGIAAGLHALVQLPTGPNEQQIVARAARQGLALQGLSAFASGPDGHPAALVIGYGTPPEHAYTSAIARLTAALMDTTPD
ncbi:MAG: PLP-dependent aminotransferase family protein, partial [Actinomycetota bacterium]|nr:PLP-dependent aminotransferase family protein [Actinomycetota bacterium]